MDDKTRAMLGDHEAAKRLTETGYFRASGELRLLGCPFCGGEAVYEKYQHASGYRWRVVCMSCTASIDPGHAQQRRLNNLIFVLKYIIRLAGFELLNRVELKDKRNGREYR